MSTLISYLINWGCNPFLEEIAWFINKSKQFNQSDIANDIALMLTLSVNRPLRVCIEISLSIDQLL